MLPERLEQLLAALHGARRLLIIAHNNPDPDAIATAVGLRDLLREIDGVESTICFRGIIGRAENKALLQYLGYPLRRLTDELVAAAPATALVDTQPGAGNNALPNHLTPRIVIDHHPWREPSAAVPYTDVRPEVGASSSILVEYLRSVEITPAPSLATALFYGIKTDTLGLARGTSSLDMSAICFLLPLIDLEALLHIERAHVPPAYFKSFAATLQTTRIYNGVLVSYIGPMEYPDLTAEMADFLLRMEGSRWVICTGVYQDRLFISVRTTHNRGAGQLVQQVVGDRGIAGGHGAMAGGQIQLNGDDPLQLAQGLTAQILSQLGIDAASAGQALV